MWTAKLDAPGFDPKPLTGPSSLTSLAVSLQGHGDRYSGSLDGTLDLNNYKLLLQPLSVQFNHDFKTLTLRQLTVGSPQIKGSIAATGTVQLDAQPVTADLSHPVERSAAADRAGRPAAGQPWRAESQGQRQPLPRRGRCRDRPAGQSWPRSTLNLDGTPQQIALHTLALKQARGGMQVNGTLTLQPALAWQVDATAEQLDPGQLLAGWNGSLNFDIASRGALPQNRPDVTLEIRKLVGTLCQRAIKGDGSLHLLPDEVVDGQLNLASGSSTVRVDAKRSGHRRHRYQRRRAQSRRDIARRLVARCRRPLERRVPCARPAAQAQRRRSAAGTVDRVSAAARRRTAAGRQRAGHQPSRRQVQPAAARRQCRRPAIFADQPAGQRHRGTAQFESRCARYPAFGDPGTERLVEGLGLARHAVRRSPCSRKDCRVYACSNPRSWPMSEAR